MVYHLDLGPLKVDGLEFTNSGYTVPISTNAGLGNSEKLGMGNCQVDLCSPVSLLGVEQHGSGGETGVTKSGC